MQQDKVSLAKAILVKEFPEEDPETIAGIFNHPIYDRALGALFGAYIGDSLGSYCQFMPEQSQQAMNKIMEMPGGGKFNISPGQFTDDSQLATHLLQGIQEYDSKKPLQDQVSNISISIAQQYVKWLESRPFNMGQTTSTALLCLQHHLKEEATQEQLLEAFNYIKNANSDSLSNGSLMRIAPMGIFIGFIRKFRPQQSQQTIKRLVRNEIQMTHANYHILFAGEHWVKMMSNIIIRQDDDPQTIHKGFRSVCGQMSDNYLIQEWKMEGFKPKLKIMKATQNMGFAKIAFSYAIHEVSYLMHDLKKQEEGVTLDSEPFYEKSMRTIIQKGGDTNTNAAIAGGMLGAVLGFKNLPDKYVVKQLKLQLPAQPTQNIHERCSFYEPRNGLILLTKLYAKFR